MAALLVISYVTVAVIFAAYHLEYDRQPFDQSVKYGLTWPAFLSIFIFLSAVEWTRFVLRWVLGVRR